MLARRIRRCACPDGHCRQRRPRVLQCWRYFSPPNGDGHALWCGMAFLHRTSLLHDAHTDVARVRLVVVLRRRQHAALATHGQRWAARPGLGAAGRGLEFRAEVPRRGRASRQRYAQRPPSSSRPTGMSSFPRHVGAASLKDKVSSDSATGICPGVAHREPLHPRKGNGPMDHSLGARKQRSLIIPATLAGSGKKETRGAETKQPVYYTNAAGRVLPPLGTILVL